MPAAPRHSRGRGNPEYNKACRSFELGCVGLGRMGRMAAAPLDSRVRGNDGEGRWNDLRLARPTSTQQPSPITTHPFPPSQSFAS